MAAPIYLVLPRLAQRTGGQEKKIHAAWRNAARLPSRTMSLEQLLDYRAARDGKITWARYFAKWGPSL